MISLKKSVTPRSADQRDFLKPVHSPGVYRLLLSVVLNAMFIVGCAYTVPLGKSDQTKVKISQYDVLIETTDYQNDPRVTYKRNTEGMHSMPVYIKNKHCMDEMAPYSSAAVLGCQ